MCRAFFLLSTAESVSFTSSLDFSPRIRQGHQHPSKGTISQASTMSNHDGTSAAYLGLRGLTAVLDLIPIGLCAYGLASSQFSALGNIIICGLSFIYSLVIIGVTLGRGRRSFHPGWNVGIDLILWLLFLVFSIVVGVTTAGSYYLADNWGDIMNDESYSYNAPSLDCSGDDCQEMADELRRIGAVLAAATAFSVILLVMHLAFFIHACVRTHRRRNQAFATPYQPAENPFNSSNNVAPVHPHQMQTAYEPMRYTPYSNTDGGAPAQAQMGTSNY